MMMMMMTQTQISTVSSAGHGHTRYTHELNKKPNAPMQNAYTQLNTEMYKSAQM